MLKAKHVLWGDAMFLRAQHFQQQALRDENLAAEVLQTVQRYAWGLRDLVLDAALLREGMVQANRLEATFRDGTRFDAPEHDPQPLSRNLNDLPQLGTQTTLYACLPNLSPFGGNTAKADEQPPRPARFRSARAMTTDLYTRGIEADLSTLELDVRLMLHEENRDGYDSVPIAKLLKNASGRWRQDEAWLPPLVTISGAPPLLEMIQRLLDIMQVKSTALTGSHRERTKNISGYGTADIASFWMLHTVNRNFAILNHLVNAQPLHPEELYLALAGFCGELITFSKNYTLTNLPQYHHEQLSDTFPKLDEIIRELLDTVISSRYAVIPLTSDKPSFHIGRLESDRLVENVDYYLSVQGDATFSRVLEEVPSRFKVGAPDDVEKILHSAMRGVPLAYTAQPPSGLPTQVGNHYFALESRGDIFQNMLKARSICIYVPESLSEFKLELFAVFR